MEDYAIRRREYVQQVRASFDEGTALDGTGSSEFDLYSEYDSLPFSGLKIRIFLAVVLFLCFVFCKVSSYEIFERNPMEIIDMISDNQYYTILQKYVKL